MKNFIFQGLREGSPLLQMISKAILCSFLFFCFSQLSIAEEIYETPEGAEAGLDPNATQTPATGVGNPRTALTNEAQQQMFGEVLHQNNPTTPDGRPMVRMMYPENVQQSMFGRVIAPRGGFYDPRVLQGAQQQQQSSAATDGDGDEDEEMDPEVPIKACMDAFTNTNKCCRSPLSCIGMGSKADDAGLALQSGQ